jgi:DNA polymerase
MTDIRTFKAALLAELYKKYDTCGTCPVGTNACTKIVWGEGDPDARIMFIGEAPGRDEDAQGRPFVGRSGQLLNKCIQAAGKVRADVFITNIVKCRPPNNRKPLPAEVAFFKPILLHEIKIIRPTIICTLGSSALEALINEPFSITKIRGKILTFENTQLMPAYHPAYVLRNPPAGKELLLDINEAIRLAHNP